MILGTEGYLAQDRVHDGAVVKNCKERTLGHAVFCRKLQSHICLKSFLLAFRRREKQNKFSYIQLQNLSAPTNALTLYIVYLMLFCSYMFRRNRHLQGASTNVVKTYSNKIVLQ